MRISKDQKSPTKIGSTVKAKRHRLEISFEKCKIREGLEWSRNMLKENTIEAKGCLKGKEINHYFKAFLAGNFL